MDARRHGNTHVVRLDRGEPVLATLQDYVGRRRIRGGSVVGLGAVEQSELGYFDPVRRAYDRRTIPEPRELLSLVATISRLDGKPFLHAHVTLAAPDHTVVGGHLFEARVAVTGEFVIHAAAIASQRRLDEATGLKLMDFDPGGTARRRRTRT
jgi:predicted DNA-binding protein with PD1-like motif